MEYQKKRAALTLALAAVGILLILGTVFTSCSAIILSKFMGLGFPWQYITWQTVSIDGFGSFKVPGNVFVQEIDGYLYVTDRPMAEDGYGIYMVEAQYSSELKMPVPPPNVANDIRKGDDFKGSGIVSNATVSFNSYEYIYNNVSSTKFCLQFVNLHTKEKRYFICWANGIDWDMMWKTGQSFRYEGENYYLLWLIPSAFVLLSIGTGAALIRINMHNKKTRKRATGKNQPQ